MATCPLCSKWYRNVRLHIGKSHYEAIWVKINDDAVPDVSYCMIKLQFVSSNPTEFDETEYIYEFNETTRANGLFHGIILKLRNSDRAAVTCFYYRRANYFDFDQHILPLGLISQHRINVRRNIQDTVVN